MYVLYYLLIFVFIIIIIVETSRAGDIDTVQIQVNAGLGEVQCVKRDLGNGIYGCTFTPSLPLPHRVHVLAYGYNCKSCPFDVSVSDEGSKDIVATGPGLYLARANRSAGFTILTKGMRFFKYFFIIKIDFEYFCNVSI